MITIIGRLEGSPRLLFRRKAHPPRRLLRGPRRVLSRLGLRIRRVTAEGIPGTAMPGFARTISSAELDAVSMFVASFPPTPVSSKLIEDAGFHRISEREAPDFEVVCLDGSRRASAAEAGNVVLLVFWGTSCAPCLEEMPDIDRLASSYRDQGLSILLICTDETDPGRIRQATENRLRVLSPVIDPGMIRVQYDVQLLPTVVLIGRDGRLIARAEGGRGWNAPALRGLLDVVLRTEPSRIPSDQQRD